MEESDHVVKIVCVLRIGALHQYISTMFVVYRCSDDAFSDLLPWVVGDIVLTRGSNRGRHNGISVRAPQTQNTHPPFKPESGAGVDCRTDDGVGVLGKGGSGSSVGIAIAAGAVVSILWSTMVDGGRRKRTTVVLSVIGDTIARSPVGRRGMLSCIP